MQYLTRHGWSGIRLANILPFPLDCVYLIRVMMSHCGCTSGTSRVLTVVSLQRLKMEALNPASAECEVRSMIKCLNAQSIAQIEIHRHLCRVYGNTRLDVQHISCRISGARSLITTLYPWPSAQWFDEVMNSCGPGVGTLSQQLEPVTRRIRCGEYSCVWMHDDDILNICSEESPKGTL